MENNNFINSIMASYDVLSEFDNRVTAEKESLYNTYNDLLADYNDDINNGLKPKTINIDGSGYTATITKDKDNAFLKMDISKLNDNQISELFDYIHGFMDMYAI